jgi:hypothetical protein
MGWRERATPVSGGGGWRSRATPVATQPEPSADAPTMSSRALTMAGDAVGQTPLGMAARGTGAIGEGIGKLFDVTSLPVSEGMSQGARRIFQPARAAGVGVANQMAGQPPAEVTRRTADAFSPSYTPTDFVDKAGSYAGENAVVMGASILSPAIGGPAAMMAQQAQTGKVSPLPALIPAAALTRRMLKPLNLAERTVPSVLKTTKGVPPAASRMALKDPAIMERAGKSESIQARSQGIIDAVNEAQTKVGDEFGTAYKDAGMNNPVDEIIAGRPMKSSSFDDLRDDYHAAIDGSLFKSMDGAGATSQMSETGKLARLTELKRALQDKAIYPQAGQKLSPSEGSHNAAIKKMAAEIDRVRGEVPGGDKLAIADDAWGEMIELKQRLMSAFKDPYTGQDYLNRILKGNTDWLTSGRNAGRVGAIERIEQITGKEVLRPALEEMAAAYLKNPDTMGLPSTGLKSIITSLVPTRLFFKRPPPSARLPISASTAASRLFRQPDKSRVEPSENTDDDRNQQRYQNNDAGDFKAQDKQQNPLRVLSEAKAKEYLEKADGSKTKARQMATADGWMIP